MNDPKELARAVALVMELVSAMRVHRQFFPRLLPLTQYDAVLAAAEGALRAWSVSGEVSRADVKAELAELDKVTEALRRTISHLPPEVLPG